MAVSFVPCVERTYNLNIALGNGTTIKADCVRFEVDGTPHSNIDRSFEQLRGENRRLENECSNRATEQRKLASKADSLNTALETAELRAESLRERLHLAEKQRDEAYNKNAELQRTLETVKGGRREAYNALACTFAVFAPQCTPLYDLPGLCSQIDNCMAGQRERIKDLEYDNLNLARESSDRASACCQIAGELERSQAHVKVLEHELQSAAAWLQVNLPIGQVKHIGLMEVAEGARQLAENTRAMRYEIEHELEHLTKQLQGIQPMSAAMTLLGADRRIRDCLEQLPPYPALELESET